MFCIDIDVSQTIVILLVTVFVGVRLANDADRRLAVFRAEHHAGDKMGVERKLEIIRQRVLGMTGEVCPLSAGRFSLPSMT